MRIIPNSTLRNLFHPCRRRRINALNLSSLFERIVVCYPVLLEPANAHSRFFPPEFGEKFAGAVDAVVHYVGVEAEIVVFGEEVSLRMAEYR